MGDPADYKDAKAMGGNPCLEQTLESYEMCCLVETFPEKCESLEDFKETLELSFLYAKSVTLGVPSQWPESQKVMAQNRRIGTSMSGIAQFIGNRGKEEFIKWCEAGYQHVKQYDATISKQFGVNESIKLTSIKPSGTVSLLAGATPGVHYPLSKHYIRRIRIGHLSELLKPLEIAGYKIEDDAYAGKTTKCVEIPISLGENIKAIPDVGIREQLENAALLQKHWADNQVSCTITFEPDTEGHLIPSLLDEFQHQLKGISFLPNIKSGAYPQMPYEEISLEEFEKRNAELKQPDFESIYSAKVQVDVEKEVFCDGDNCIKVKKE